MASKSKRVATGDNKACSRAYSYKRDADGRVICVDACGKRAPLSKCVSLATPDDSGAVHVRFKRSCRLDDGLKKQLEDRVKGKGTVYEFED